MTIKSGLLLLAAGTVAMAAVLAPASQARAQARVAPITDFSAQQDKKKKGGPKKGAPRVAPQHVAPHQAAPRQVAPRRVAPRTTAPRTVAPKVGGAKVRRPKVGGPATGAPKVGGAKAVAPKIAAPAGPARVFKPKGANVGVVTAHRLRGVPQRGAGRASIRGRNFSTWRAGNYRVRHGGRWRTFVALSALGAILVGTNHFYPYAYIAAPEDYCDGLTADGCELVWDEVETIEGDRVGQCVAYCPWQ